MDGSDGPVKAYVILKKKPWIYAGGKILTPPGRLLSNTLVFGGQVAQ